MAARCNIEVKEWMEEAEQVAEELIRAGGDSSRFEASVLRPRSRNKRERHLGHLTRHLTPHAKTGSLLFRTFSRSGKAFEVRRHGLVRLVIRNMLFYLFPGASL